MSRGFLLFVGILLAVVYPPLTTLVERGPVAAFQFFNTDAFTYLAVARHSVGKPFFTFDGQRPTNGFHPLWQWILAGLAAWTGPHDQESLLMGAFLLSVLLVALGTAGFGLAVAEMTGSAVAALLAAVPGFHYLAAGALLEPQYGSRWSFINGMESPVSIFLFGLLLLYLVRSDALATPSPKGLSTTAGLLTLLTLARLDDGFLLLPPLLVIGSSPAFAGRRAASFLWFLALPVIGLGGYLLYNFWHVGSFLPLSALSKGGFGLDENLRCLVQTLYPNTVIKSQTGFAWKEIAYRTVQLWAPLAVALLWLTHRFAARSSRPGPLIAPFLADRDGRLLFLLSGGVVLKALYNLLNVLMVHTGPWYYAVSFLVSDLIVARGVARLVAPIEHPGRAERVPPSPGAAVEEGGGAAAGSSRALRTVARSLAPATALLWAVAIGLLSVQANGFLRFKLATDYNKHLFRFWANRAALTAGVKAGAPGSGVLEFDDGIFSFSLDVPVLHGHCFAADPELLAARARGALFRTAWERGFRVFATLAYLRRPLPPDLDQATLEAVCLGEFMRSERERNWVCAVAYRDPVTQVTFIRFEPRAAAAPPPASSTHELPFSHD